MVKILLILFFVICLYSLFPPKEKISRNIIFKALGLCLIFAASFRGKGVDRDYDSYIEMFYNYNDILLEPAFKFISYFIYTFMSGNYLYLFIVFGIIGVYVKLFAIKQLTQLWFLSLLIYFSYFFIMHEMTQIRVGVASAFLLLCIKPIYERDFKLFLIFSTTAFLFHFSAIIIFPLYFLGNKTRKTWLLLAVPIGYLIHFSGITIIGTIPIPGIQEKLAMYQQLHELGDENWTKINVFKLVFLARIVIFYILLFKYDSIIANNKYAGVLINIFGISLMSFLALSFIPVLGVRISDLLGVVEIVLIPLLFYCFKPEFFSRSIVTIIGLSLFLIILFYDKLIIG